MDIEKLDINAVCFGILCNFTPVCGEERAKEAVELVRKLQAENEKLRAELQKSEHDNVNLTGELAKVAAELDDLRTQWDMYGGDVGITAVYKELEQVKRTLAMMWFAYVNSDKEDPHNYETEALEEAERLLGPWKECMPKYLKRGQEE